MENGSTLIQFLLTPNPAIITGLGQKVKPIGLHERPGVDSWCVWKDFGLINIKKLFGCLFDRKFNFSFPRPPPLANPKKTIRNEKGVENILASWNHLIINEAIRVVGQELNRNFCYLCVPHDIIDESFPDWAGRMSVETVIPGETKFMLERFDTGFTDGCHRVIASDHDPSSRKHFRSCLDQAVYYAQTCKSRYCYLISNKELLIIRRRYDPDCIQKPKTRATIPSSSLASGSPKRLCLEPAFSHLKRSKSTTTTIFPQSSISIPISPPVPKSRCRPTSTPQSKRWITAIKPPSAQNPKERHPHRPTQQFPFSQRFPTGYPAAPPTAPRQQRPPKLNIWLATINRPFILKSRNRPLFLPPFAPPLIILNRPRQQPGTPPPLPTTCLLPQELTSCPSPPTVPSSSFRSSDSGNHEADVQIAVIPWDDEEAGGLTINMGLFVLHILASLSGDMKHDYPNFWEDKAYEGLRTGIFARDGKGLI
ncbi:hypothetical protein MMC30_006591 [Trapelia coarctata]|nr:hypothetical protein [Trapelia coarctata]